MALSNILVIHYSQTGQLTNIVRSVLDPLQNVEGITLTMEELSPVKPYPFPWTSKEFFDAFPESYEEVPCKMNPYRFETIIPFDLIILCYQVWFLSPSIPISSFLQSEEAQKIFKNTPVITVIGCRNMWLSAQEKIKRRLKALEAKLIANIVLVDRAYNLVSVYTILRWMLYGKKGKSGVSDKDIKEASKFGKIILYSLAQSENNFASLQSNLVESGAVAVVPNLIGLEKTANKLFALWAKFVRKKGGPSNPKRRLRLRFFALYLLIGIVLLSSVTTALYHLTKFFRLKKIKRDIAYLQYVSYEENRIVTTKFSEIVSSAPYYPSGETPDGRGKKVKTLS